MLTLLVRGPSRFLLQPLQTQSFSLRFLVGLLTPIFIKRSTLGAAPVELSRVDFTIEFEWSEAELLQSDTCLFFSRLVSSCRIRTQTLTTMLPPFSLEEYGISPEYGFLPSKPPLNCLSNAYYAKWESIISNLQPLLLSKRIRTMIDGLPVLSTRHLHDEPEWRRAYVVLVFMLHGYVWGGDRPVSVCPPST